MFVMGDEGWVLEIVVGFAALISAATYLAVTGNLVGYIIYSLINLILSIPLYFVFVLLGVPLMDFFTPWNIIVPLGLALSSLPTIWYRARLADSWLVGFGWWMAVWVLFPIYVLVDALFFVNIGGGDYI